MTGSRKLGTYVAPYESGEHSIKVRLKNGIILMKGDIVTDDMIEDYKDPIWEKLVNLLYNNYSNPFGGPSKNHGDMANMILDLINNKEK